MAAGLAGLAWMGIGWQTHAPRVVDAALRAPPAAPVTAPGRMPVRAVADEPLSVPGSGESPPGVTRAQWLALQDELRSRPDGAAELARIADYLAWSDTLRRFREASADSAERQRLALALDAGLAARLRAGEISSAEARQIKSAILDVTQSDAAERAPTLQRWLAAETAATQPDPRQAEFDQRQAEIVSAWAGKPPNARDPAVLERDLEALRRQVFLPATPSATR